MNEAPEEQDPDFCPVEGGPSVWSVWVREEIEAGRPRPFKGEATIPPADYSRIVGLIAGGGRA